MLFSIVIPVYNVEKYIDECLKSVLIQDFSDYEVVLVDDGSSDSSGEICDRYAGEYENIRAVHQVNGGLSDARNTGVREAKGEYICFLDSDDYWSTSSALSEIAQAVEKSRPDVIRIEKQKLLATTGETIENGPVDFSMFENLSPADTLMKLMQEDTLKEGSTLLVQSRKFFTDNALFFKKGIKSEDIEWSVRLYANEPTWEFVPDRIYVYRIGREGSISTKVGYKHLTDCCDSLESSVDVIRRCSDTARQALTAFIMYNLAITCAHVRNSDISKDEKKVLDRRLKALCDEHLPGHVIGRKLKMSYSVYKVGGYKLMSFVLGMFLKLRGR